MKTPKFVCKSTAQRKWNLKRWHLLVKGGGSLHVLQQRNPRHKSYEKRANRLIQFFFDNENFIFRGSFPASWWHKVTGYSYSSRRRKSRSEKDKVNNLKVIWVQSVFTPTLGHAAVTYRETYDFVAYAMRACEFRVRRVRLGLLFLVGSGEQNRWVVVSFSGVAS